MKREQEDNSCESGSDGGSGDEKEIRLRFAINDDTIDCDSGDEDASRCGDASGDDDDEYSSVKHEQFVRDFKLRMSKLEPEDLETYLEIFQEANTKIGI